MKNTVKEKSELELLQEDIDGLQKESTGLKTEIDELEKQLLESAEAVQLIKNPPRYGISEEKRFELFEEMQSVLASAKNEEERQQKLSALEKAIEQGEALLFEKRKRLAAVEKQIQFLEAEADWLENYAAYVPRFKDGYQIPESQKKKQRQAEYYLNLNQNHLEELRQAAETPQKIYEWEKRHPQLEAIEDRIARWQVLVDEGEKELKQSLCINQSHFRQYIKARVLIDASFQNLLEAQQAYVVALQSFKDETRGHQEILDIDLSVLTLGEMPSLELGRGDRVEIVRPKKERARKQTSQKGIRIVDEFSVSNY